MRPRKKDRHLPPCVYHRHGAYWLVRRGKWTRLGNDLAGALRSYASHHSQAKGGISALIEEAWPSVIRGVSKGTEAQYMAARRKLEYMLQDFATPDQVRPKDVFRIRRLLADQPNTANRCISILRMVFDYAVEEEIVEHNPCAGVKRLTEGKRDRYITDAEYVAILEEAEPLLQVIIHLCYLTGQRIGDVLQIRLEHLTDEGIAFKQGKTGTRLLVRWTPELRQAVELAKVLQGDVRSMTHLITRRTRPLPYSTMHGWWLAACEAAGVKDARVHDIRAKSLTDAKRQGQDATALAGHASPQMTERYIRLRETPAVVGPKAVGKG